MHLLKTSIAARSGELSERRRSGLPIDAGHTGRLAAERKALTRCLTRYKLLGCDKEGCSPPVIPVRIPIGQSQGELDAQAEAARQRYLFWQKITVGGYLVGSVLTGGALFGGGSAAGALVPALVP